MLNLHKITCVLFIFSLFTLPVFAQPNLEYESIPENFGIDIPSAVVAININYDEVDTERQIFHLFLPDTTGNFPLVVYIHGGGFTGGNPGTVFNNSDRMTEVKYFLENGFAYASFGYRVINSDQADTEGVIKSLNDSKRALQYVRHYADELNINPDKIGLVGTSAGAGTSLWLSTRSDMANPNASDPILRESTRVCAVAAIGSQSTYDIYKWETEVYNDFDGKGTNYTLDSMANLLSFERFSNFYGGLDSVYQVVHDPALIQYREDVDMLYHMSSDDPPLYVLSRSGAVHPGDDLFHHSYHGQAIYETALVANLPEVKADIRAQSINTTEDETHYEFLFRHVNACLAITSTSDEVKNEDDRVFIFPNPARTQFTIQLQNDGIKLVEAYTISGQFMGRINGKNSNMLTIPTSSLKPGMYVLRITTTNGNKVARKLLVE